MMDITIFSSVASGLNQVYHSTKALLDLKVETETAVKINALAGQVGDLMGKFIAAQSAHMECQEKAMNLEKEVTRLKTFETEKQRYVMQKIGENSFAYALKPEAAGEEPLHHICANCYADGYKSVLQFNRYHGNFSVLVCPRCKAETLTPHGIKSDYVSVNRDNHGAF